MPTTQSRADQPRSVRHRLTATLAAAATVAVTATAGLTGTLATADTASAANSCGKADFKDAKPGTGHYEAITWMNCEGISAGYADNTFRKNRNVTRGEVAAFLYQQVMPSHPQDGKRYFTDVNPGGAYYDAITWFAQSGISVGYQDKSFRPSQAVTRGELASFLYRLADSPKTGGGSFSDMNWNSNFYTAASWLLKSGITSGYENGSFQPNAKITRAETAAFLMNARQEVAGQGDVKTSQVKPISDNFQRASAVQSTWKTKAAQWATTKANASGTYYKWGGNGPHGYDCSGFTTSAFSAAGKHLPRTSKTQYTAADKYVPLSQAKVGDLVYWSNNGKASGVYHVAIVVGDGKIAHARNSSIGVSVTKINYSPYNMMGVAGRFN